MRLPIKAIAICTIKKAGSYCKNNDWDSELLLIKLDQYII